MSAFSQLQNFLLTLFIGSGHASVTSLSQHYTAFHAKMFSELSDKIFMICLFRFFFFFGVFFYSKETAQSSLMASLSLTMSYYKRKCFRSVSNLACKCRDFTIRKFFNMVYRWPKGGWRQERQEWIWFRSTLLPASTWKSAAAKPTNFCKWRYHCYVLLPSHCFNTNNKSRWLSVLSSGVYRCVCVCVCIGLNSISI